MPAQSHVRSSCFCVNHLIKTSCEGINCCLFNNVVKHAVNHVFFYFKKRVHVHLLKLELLASCIKCYASLFLGGSSATAFNIICAVHHSILLLWDIWLGGTNLQMKTTVICGYLVYAIGCYVTNRTIFMTCDWLWFGIPESCSISGLCI